jgi:ornithine cyclodeaminase/alanine dehydrogenase-like protein (mu-crystallin family)
LNTTETLILTASDVARCLGAAECRGAVERAFALLAERRVPAARAVGFEAQAGTFHAKIALYDAGRPRFVAKVNGNFPANPGSNGLPTIQGVLLLADSVDGRPLAIMDSGAVTALRTAAASAVAAAHLARRDAAVLAVVGCGAQGAAHVEALRAVRAFKEIRLHDLVKERARGLATLYGSQVACRVVDSVADATLGADVVVTCTGGAEFVLDRAHVRPGSFVAAVGTDNPYKREVHPSLTGAARVVVDDLVQCASGGDLHHALEAGAMTEDDVHADLATVVARRHAPLVENAIVMFDSTGVALEDAAAADLAYERARSLGVGRMVRLGA